MIDWRHLLLLLTLGACAAVADAPRLEVVARLEQPPGNLTVTPSGRLIVSLHEHFRPRLRVVEVVEGRLVRPFPDPGWNAPGGRTLDSVLGIQADHLGVVWMLDNGRRRSRQPQLVGWHTPANRLERVIPLRAPATRPGSFLNDLAVDRRHGAIYLADTGGRGTPAALIVVDSWSGRARRVLEGHVSVAAGPLPMVASGQLLQVRTPRGRISPRVGVNPIALDSADEWLYYGPMTGEWLYRVRTRDLRDTSLSAAQLASRVERWARRPACDGITIDDRGNVYVTDFGADAIGVIDARTRAYRVLVRDPRLVWPDAFSFGPDGYLYVVAAQLQRGPALNAGRDLALRPFLIVRLRPLAPGRIGR